MYFSNEETMNGLECVFGDSGSGLDQKYQFFFA
jgi:hypothetical protein